MNKSNKALVAYYYDVVTPTMYKCKICGKCRTKPTGSGYTNLLSHLDSQHEGHRERYTEALTDSATSLDDFGFTNPAKTNMAN